MLTDWEIRRGIVAYGRRFYDAGLVAANDGNISVRIMGDRLMITPSGSALGNLNVENLVYVDLSGQVLSGRMKPSSELPMHLAIYRKRPDVSAIIHTHPPVSTAFSVARISLSEPVLPEVILGFGDIPIAPYATPGTPEGAQILDTIIDTHDVVILDHHGAVAVGATLEEAYQKMERLEHTAKTLLAAHQLGGVSVLPDEEVEKLKTLRRQSL